MQDLQNYKIVKRCNIGLCLLYLDHFNKLYIFMDS